MTDETYNEIVEYLAVTEEGELTMKGFVQLYQLQTGTLLRSSHDDWTSEADMSRLANRKRRFRNREGLESLGLRTSDAQTRLDTKEDSRNDREVIGRSW